MQPLTGQRTRRAGTDKPARKKSSTDLSALSPQLGAQLVEQNVGAALAPTAIVEIVQECRLLGEDQPRAGAFGLEYHGRQRGRDRLAIQLHAVAVDDALVRHDVVVEAIESR